MLPEEVGLRNAGIRQNHGKEPGAPLVGSQVTEVLAAVKAWREADSKIEDARRYGSEIPRDRFDRLLRSAYVLRAEARLKLLSIPYDNRCDLAWYHPHLVPEEAVLHRCPLPRGALLREEVELFAAEFERADRHPDYWYVLIPDDRRSADALNELLEASAAWIFADGCLKSNLGTWNAPAKLDKLLEAAKRRAIAWDAVEPADRRTLQLSHPHIVPATDADAAASELPHGLISIETFEKVGREGGDPEDTAAKFAEAGVPVPDETITAAVVLAEIRLERAARVADAGFPDTGTAAAAAAD